MKSTNHTLSEHGKRPTKDKQLNSTNFVLFSHYRLVNEKRNQTAQGFFWGVQRDNKNVMAYEFLGLCRQFGLRFGWMYFAWRGIIMKSCFCQPQKGLWLKNISFNFFVLRKSNWGIPTQTSIINMRKMCILKFKNFLQFAINWSISKHSWLAV